MPYLKHMPLGSIEHMLNLSTAGQAAAIGPRVGRKMEYPEKREAAFRPGTLARVQSALTEGENQVGFIREAVERELERRGK
jgi:hypothetical protein